MTELELLKEMIAEARIASPEFNKKYAYWVETRRKAPDYSWLYDGLKGALGVERFKSYLEEFLKDK